MYQFSDLYLPGKSSNSWGRGEQTKRERLFTDGMQLYIYRWRLGLSYKELLQIFEQSLELFENPLETRILFSLAKVKAER
jgi:hypothetical protein